MIFSAMKSLTLEKSGGCAFCYFDLLKYGGFNQWKNKKNIRPMNLGRHTKSLLFICDVIAQGDEEGSTLVPPQNVNVETWIPPVMRFGGGGSLGNSQTRSMGAV